MAKTTHRASLMSDDGSQYLLPMFAVLRYRYAIQAVRPTHHWWQCPRGLAWFQVLMVWSLVKPSACAEPLSRIGDYLRAARGPGLLRQIMKRTAFPHERSPTRSPPCQLFHRRGSEVAETNFADLRDIVRELAQAQVRTEARVEELAQAQARTEA